MLLQYYIYMINPVKQVDDYRKTARVHKDVTVDGYIKKNIMVIMESQCGRFLGGWKSIFKIFFFGHF